MRKKVVVLSGAGMSAESGIETFRASDGLWENHSVQDVATFDGWLRDPKLVTRFYNERRKQLLDVEPNLGHIGLAELEKRFDVDIVTQNVDDLHERAGSSRVTHLHGKLKEVKCDHPNCIEPYEISHWEVNIGDLCRSGHQIRPNIVWFGEAVPEIENAIKLVEKADIILIVGTSMNVYPAAGLVEYAKRSSEIYLIDPKLPKGVDTNRINYIAKGASEGVKDFIEMIWE